MAAEDGDDETRDADKLARELAEACTVLGRELSRLAGFVQWADSVVSSAEAATKAGLPPAEVTDSAERLTQSRPTCISSMEPAQGPEWFYIGDGKFAQLLADAEAAAA